MVICSDSLEFAAEVLAEGSDAHSGLAPARGDGTMPLAAALLGGRHYVHVGAAPFPAWSLLVLTADAAQSQFDQLIALSRNGHDLPDRTACLARTGTRFHGYKGRPWSAAPGNIHLTVHFAPRCAIERFEVAFTILAALSVVDAIDEVPGLRHRPGIRWINDVVVGDAKLGGVLAYTQTRGQTVTSAVLGIGVNVETTPAVEPSPFVPAVSSISDLVADGSSASLRTLLDGLLGALQRNYDLLLQAGYRPLLERYRERSTVIGRECTICTEESDREPEVIAAGRVVAVGEGLELHLEGRDLPMTRGRLLLGRPQAVAGAGGYAVCPMPGPAGPRSNAGGRGEHGARRRN